ncbi:MAG: putative maltokinase, partial [Burkholderiaceae bacterium]
GDRNGVRTPMQWSPDRNAGFSHAHPQTLYLQPILGAVYGYEALNVESQVRDNSSLLNWTKRMLAVRKTSHAFGRGKRIFLKPGNRKILAYVSQYEDDTILSVFNLARAAQPVELDLSPWKGRVPVEMLGRVSFPPVGDLPYLLTLPSHGFYWFRLSVEADMPAWHQEGTALQDYPTLVLFDGWTSFFRERVMPWRIGMAERMRKQFETDTLPRYIEHQRWYASKGDPITRARLADQVVWDSDGSSWMLPLLQLDGPSEDSTYFMPLALAWEEDDEERTQRLSQAALAKIRQQANVGIMGDAFFDDTFSRALVTAIGNNLELTSANGHLRFKSTAAFATLKADIATLEVSRPSGLSSNTVVTLGESLFLKAYRRLREGVNPELEMGRFLTDVVAYPNCVPVLGALEYFGNDGKVMTLALVQAHVANQGDGWSYVLNYLERQLEDVRTQVPNTDPALEAPDIHGGFLAVVATLGQRTAELHLALARDTGHSAFDPEPLTAADVTAMRARASGEAVSTLALLRQQLPQLPAAAQADAESVLALQQRLAAHFDAAGPATGGGIKTRYHGDYHLGQVLVTHHDFVIIDFEGEPARSFEQRRTKSSPLRDVAGMLRSFSYARWSAIRRVVHDEEDMARLSGVAEAWERSSRDAFLDAYSSTLADAGTALVMDEDLLALFELEKALYELRYEMNNRIDWVQVPLQGILALLQDRPAT